MPSLRTSEEVVRSPIDGTELFRLATTGANWQATMAAVRDYIYGVVSGDATIAAGGALTIAAGAVTYAKMQNVSTNGRLLGRSTAGAGVIQELTTSQALDFITQTQGEMAIRGAGGWQTLPVDTLGKMLMTQGAGFNVVWSFINSNVGVFTRDISVSGGTQAITTPGFKPQWGAFVFVNPNTGGFSVGFVDAQLNQNTVLGLDGSSPYNLTVGTGQLCWYQNSAGSNIAKASLTSWDTNGFTLTWATKVGTPTGTASIIYIVRR